MNKFLSTAVLISSLSSPAVNAEETPYQNSMPMPMSSPPSQCCASGSIYDTANRYNDNPAFKFLDILIYRPIGLAATLAGTGLFVGLSPLTALASIPRPHNAFEETYKILIRIPGAYTFIRPVGDTSLPSYDARYPLASRR